MDEALTLIAKLTAERDAAAELLARTDDALLRTYAAANRVGAPFAVLDWIEAYLRTTNKAAAALGADVVGDQRFVFDLRAGRSMRRKTEALVRAYLEAASWGCELKAAAQPQSVPGH